MTDLHIALAHFEKQAANGDSLQKNWMLAAFETAKRLGLCSDIDDKPAEPETLPDCLSWSKEQWQSYSDATWKGFAFSADDVCAQLDRLDGQEYARQLALDQSDF